MDPNADHNGSPTNQEYISFIESRKEPGNWFIHGYAESPERQDSGVYIEGIGTYCEVDDGDVVDFATTFRHADELTAGRDTSLWCWYD